MSAILVPNIVMMKALPYKIPINDNESFIVRRDAKQYFYSALHSHEEIQITLILDCTGTVFIGDYIGHFKKYDLFIIGSNCPHMFKIDEKYIEGNFDLNPRAISIYLSDYFFNENKSIMPELSQVQKFLKKSTQVYNTNVKLNGELVRKIKTLPSLKGTQKYICLISVLDDLMQIEHYSLILQDLFENGLNEEEGDRLKKIFDFTFENCDQKITIEKVADLANFSSNSFCRFFKKSTGKTYADFLKSVRINRAAKLLISSDMSVSQIAELSGYNNISNFNRQFLSIKSESPLQYRKRIHELQYEDEI